MTDDERAEFARAEAKAFYGQPMRTAFNADARANAEADEHAVDAANIRNAITERVAAGASVFDLMDLYGLSRREARQAWMEAA